MTSPHPNTQKPQNEIYNDIEEKFSLQDFVTKVLCHSFSQNISPIQVDKGKGQKFEKFKKTIAEMFVVLDSP